MTHREIKVDGVKIHVEERGSGEAAILLLHGAVSSARSFEAITEALSRKYRVIAPDLRGMGRSERVRTMPATAWCDDTLAVLDELGISAIHICGTSLGARVALRVALARPTSVLSICLDAPVLFEEAAGRSYLESVFRDNLQPEFATQLRHWNGDDWEVVRDNYLELRQTPGLQEYFDLRGDLESLDCRAAVTRGDIDDSIHPLLHSYDAHRQLSSSRLWIRPATPFSLMRFAGAEFTDFYANFVSGAL